MAKKKVTKHKYILATASTQSDWDSADFALIYVDEQRIAYFKKMRDLAITTIAAGANNIQVYADNADFYQDKSELGEEWYQHIEKFVCEIIELEDSVIAAFTEPEQQLQGGIMTFDYEGITFMTSGKHTGEEYWCDVPYYVIFDEPKPEYKKGS